jgi:hypothetical protein
MRVRENHALVREPVHVWRGDLPIRIQRMHVAVAQVIAKDVNDVGLWGRRGKSSARAQARKADSEEKTNDSHGGEALHKNVPHSAD